MSEPVVWVESASMPADPALLSAAELARRDRLVRAADRTAYVAAHVLVRQCVAELLGIRPSLVEIEQRCPRCGPGHGAPAVVGHPQIGVSLSHSTLHVAAIAALGPCGIDVETVDRAVVVPTALSAREQSWVAQQHDPTLAFLHLWVRKEATVKADGVPLDEAATVDVLTDGPDGLRPDETFGVWDTPDAIAAWKIR